MGARKKLNLAYVYGSFVLAVLVGAWTESSLVFALMFALAIGSCLYNGEIRARRQRP